MTKEKLENLGKLIPIGGFYILLCSSIKHYIFFKQFNISITNYLSISEYATLFVDDILIYFSIFGLALFINEITLIAYPDDNLESDNIDYNQFKNRKITLIVLSIITVITISILAQITESFYDILNILKVGILILLIFLYFFMNTLKTKLKFSYRGLILFIILLHSGMDGLIGAHSIFENRNELNYKISTVDNLIITNDEVHYLGKSEKYLFLYNSIKRESTIIPSSKLEKIEIVEVEKNGS